MTTLNRRAFIAALLAPFLARFRKLFPPSRRWVPSRAQTKMMEWYFSESSRFQFGFTGFKLAPLQEEATGQFLFGSNLIVTTPRSIFKLSGFNPEQIPFAYVEPLQMPWVGQRPVTGQGGLDAVS